MGGAKGSGCQFVGGEIEGEGVDRVGGDGVAGGCDGDVFAADGRLADVEAEVAVAVVAIGVETDVGVARDGGWEVAELVEGLGSDVVKVVVAAGTGDEVGNLVAADGAGEALVVVDVAGEDEVGPATGSGGRFGEDAVEVLAAAVVVVEGVDRVVHGEEEGEIRG